MVSHPGIQPGGGIAETFANVVTPRGTALTPNEDALLYSRGFAQLTSRSALQFSLKEKFEAAASLIVEPRPNKMKYFMNHNETQWSRAPEQFSIEHNAPRTNRAGGIDRRASFTRAGEQLAAPGSQTGLGRN